MYDTAWNDQFPSGGQAYAGYVDGHVGSQPNYNWIVTTFPHAHHLSIAIFASDNADCLDIEPGAASPASAAAWYERQVARKVWRPCFYASASLMESDIIPIVRSSGFNRADIRLWSAHYGGGAHICGPSSCGLTSIEMDGTQFTDTAMGRNLDESLLLGNFFPDPPPLPGYGPPRNLQAHPGHTSVKLTWETPGTAGLPNPAEYQVFIYKGTVTNRDTIVPSYPRTLGAVLEYQGGSLERGHQYTVHVVAAGPNGTHTRPYTFASATFTTGLAVEKAGRMLVGLGCSYEVFALTTRRVPTLSQYCRRHRWFEAALFGSLLIHFHIRKEVCGP